MRSYLYIHFLQKMSNRPDTKLRRLRTNILEATAASPLKLRH